MSINLLESPGRLDPGALIQECRRLVSYFEDFLRSTPGAPALRFPADAPTPPASPPVTRFRRADAKRQFRRTRFCFTC
jgi:hypothetical protein